MRRACNHKNKRHKNDKTRIVKKRDAYNQSGLNPAAARRAVVADPVTGEFLRHEPIPLALARETIAALKGEGFPINVYRASAGWVRPVALVEEEE